MKNTRPDAINANIFREYDIRGVADADLTDDKVYRLGRGFGTYYAARRRMTVCVGHDVRLSSPRIAGIINQALVDSGCDVVFVGEVPTPLLYYALYHYEIPSGIMITASHNPKEFNGFKVCAEKMSLYGADIQKLRRIVEDAEFVSGKGSVEERDVAPDYLKELMKGVKVKPGLKVVVDTGNGACGPLVEKILKDLGVPARILFKEPDGNFPNHLPDPTVPKYIAQLIATVKEGGYDCGIGLDGDGDRIGVVDEKGGIIWGDVLLALYAEEVIRRQPGAKIIFEVKCSKGLVERIQALGGTPIMYRTGHSLIKAKMKEESAPLAGEMSGHMFFADRYYGYDDAVYASLRLLEILGGTDKLSGLAARVPKYFSTPEIRVETTDEMKFGVVDRIKEDFRRSYPILDIDGVRVDFGDGWGLVRASNTQPVLVVRCEAKTRERLESIREIVFQKLGEQGLIVPAENR
jgi:phosphomannomutase/phosphoglucomutase